MSLYMQGGLIMIDRCTFNLLSRGHADQRSTLNGVENPV